MIKLNHLSFSFGQKKILNNLDFEIKNKDYLAIIGPNGVGKSTLIKLLIGIYKSSHEEILIDDKCITCYNKFSKIGYVPQVKAKPSELPITPREIFKLIINDQKKIEEVVKELNIEKILDIKINDLSGGQLQRVNICKALLHDVEYLILDEPTTGLDIASRKNLNDLLNKMNKKGMTIIVVSHYLNEVEENITAILDLEKNEYKRVKNV